MIVYARHPTCMYSQQHGVNFKRYLFSCFPIARLCVPFEINNHIAIGPFGGGAHRFLNGSNDVAHAV
jgi:hypothetical protein